MVLARRAGRNPAPAATTARIMSAAAAEAMVALTPNNCVETYLLTASAAGMPMARPRGHQHHGLPHDHPYYLPARCAERHAEGQGGHGDQGEQRAARQCCAVRIGDRTEIWPCLTS